MEEKPEESVAEYTLFSSFIVGSDTRIWFLCAGVIHVVMAGSTLFDRLAEMKPRQSDADLIVVTAVTLITVLIVFFPPLDGTIFRFGFGLVFLLFVPGYALVSALFPDAPSEGPSTRSDAHGFDILPGRLSSASGIDAVDRLGLGFATSVATVPLIGIALSFTPWGLRLTSTVVAVAGITLTAIAVGRYRREQLPEDRRFGLPYQAWIASGRARMFGADSRIDLLLTIVLAVSVLLAFGSVAFAVASPPDGEQYTEFYLLTEDSSGELVADSYPTDLDAGESEPIIVGIENNEQRSVEYTVVVEVQEVEILDDNTVRVVDREHVDTLETTLDDNENWHTEHDLSATMSGTDLRVSYLLYTDAPPAVPSTETADQSLHLWVDIDEPTDGPDT